MAEFEPVGFGAFVTGVNEGWKNMNARLKEADDLRLASRAWDFAEAQDKARKEKGEPTGTTIGPPISAATGPGADQSDPGSATGTWNTSSIGDTSQTGEGHVAPKAERLAYIEEQAKKKGLNYAALAATVGLEGLNKYHGDVGDGGGSYGDFQLHIGGGSMGDAAIAAGINIKDPNTWKQQVDFVTDQMVAHKGDANWYASQWHGPRGKAPWAVQNFSNPEAQPPAGYLPPTQSAATPPVEGAPAEGVPQITPASAIGAPLRGVPSTAAPETPPAPEVAPPVTAQVGQTAALERQVGPTSTMPGQVYGQDKEGGPTSFRGASRLGIPLGAYGDNKGLRGASDPTSPAWFNQQTQGVPGKQLYDESGNPIAAGGAPAAAIGPQTALTPSQAPQQPRSQIEALAMVAQQHGLDLTLSPKGGSGLYNNTSIG